MSDLDEFDITKEPEDEKGKEPEEEEQSKAQESFEKPEEAQNEDELMTTEQKEQRQKLLDRIELFQFCEYNKDRISKYANSFKNLQNMTNEKLQELLNNLLKSMEKAQNLNIIIEGINTVGYNMLETMLSQAKIKANGLSDALRSPEMNPKMNRMIEGLLLKYNVSTNTSLEFELGMSLINSILVMDAINRKREEESKPNISQPSNNNNNIFENRK